MGIEDSTQRIQGGLAKIRYAAKEKTEEEHLDLFINYLYDLIEYWDSLEKSSMEKLEGLMHSVLATLDGCGMEVPPYQVIPMVTPEGEDEWVSSGINLSSRLHDYYNHIRDKKKSTS